MPSNLKTIVSALLVLATMSIGSSALPLEAERRSTQAGGWDATCEDKRLFDDICACDLGLNFGFCYGLPTCKECGIPCDECE